jgi:hypothetical protein
MTGWSSEVTGRPAGRASRAMPEFLRRARGRRWTGLHKARREPVNQSLRGGSQTSGIACSGVSEPVIAALRRGNRRRSFRLHRRSCPRIPPIRSCDAGLRSTSVSSAPGQCDSAVLRPACQSFPPEGWISSAYYVALPPSMSRAPAGETAGCIQFGEPPAELRLDLGPRRVIRPRVGGLVLFPSYIWHGTVPFHDENAENDRGF